MAENGVKYDTGWQLDEYFCMRPMVVSYFIMLMTYIDSMIVQEKFSSIFEILYKLFKQKLTHNTFPTIIPGSL